MKFSVIKLIERFGLTNMSDQQNSFLSITSPVLFVVSQTTEKSVILYDLEHLLGKVQLNF